MNLKITIALTLFCSVIVLNSCNSKKSDYGKIIGQEYYSLRQFKPFFKFQEVGGSLININPNTEFTINHYKSGVINILAFEKKVDELERRDKYSLLDILEISDLKQNQQIARGNCRSNEKYDREIFAI